MTCPVSSCLGPFQPPFWNGLQSHQFSTAALVFWYPVLTPSARGTSCLSSIPILPSLRPLTWGLLAPRSQISPAGRSPLSPSSRSPSELNPSSLTRDQSHAVFNFCPQESTGMNVVIKNMAGAIQYFQVCIFPQNSVYVHLIYLEAEDMNQKKTVFLLGTCNGYSYQKHVLYITGMHFCGHLGPEIHRCFGITYEHI